MSADVDLEALRHGRCLLIATDTVYGLAALPGSPGYSEIFTLKQRPAGQVLPWLIADAAQLERWAAEPPAYARRLAAALWPGGLTLVLRASERARALGCIAADGTVALRVPDDARCRSLLAALDAPLACTSANLHGQPAPVHLEDIHPSLEPWCAQVIAPLCPGGAASTIVDCTGGSPRILREGCIPAAAVAFAASAGA